MHGVYKGLINGVHQRGEGGFLFVRGDEQAYMFPRELDQADLREGLETILCDEAAQDVFYVVEERDGHAHVLAYPRTVVRSELELEVERQLRARGARGADNPANPGAGDGSDTAASDP